MEDPTSSNRRESERALVGQHDPSARDLPYQSPREVDGGHIPPLATSNNNDGNAHRGVHSDQEREADPERVLRLRTAAATGLIGAAQIDVLLVLRTIGCIPSGETSADRVPPTEAHVQLAYEMLDELAREARGKRSYAIQRAAARKRRESWRRRLADVEAPEHFWAKEICRICLADDEPLVVPTERAEEDRRGDCAWVLPCGHAYHRRCAATWLLEQKGSCPHCRSAVPTVTQDGRRGRGFKRTRTATEASGVGPDTSQDGALAMELQAAEQNFEMGSDEDPDVEPLEVACARHAEDNRLDDLARARRALAEQTRAAKGARDAEFDAAVELVRMQVVAELADTTRVWLLAGVYGKVPSVISCIDDVGALHGAAGVLARARAPCMPYASGELLHSLGAEVQPERGRANRRMNGAAVVAPTANGLRARLMEAGLPTTVRWLVITPRECEAEDAKGGGGVWKATRRVVETVVRERLVAERVTTGGVG